jgi:TDG/mug DNA glycosylase family protein
MPGVVSLQKKEYYGHPQNSFWRIMGDLFGASPSLPYRHRIDILSDRRISLFDTLKSCIRPGSADGDIREKVPHDFKRFFSRHRSVAHIFFDGGMAFDTFRRMILPTLEKDNFVMTPLPSTSARNARITYQQKLKAWSVVRYAADERDRHAS